jgi:ABC-type uncharacterized transport system substrate-binding protein
MIQGMPTTRRTIQNLLTGILCLWALMCPLQSFSRADRYRTAPITNHGEKWRVGYYEGGAYINYPANLRAIAKGLAELGWIEDIGKPDTENPSDTRGIWKNLTQAKSDYIQFVEDAFYSADWNETLRAANRATAMEQLRRKRLDFRIAMGTWAGQDLANNLHSVFTMVVSSSDPVASGIVKSAGRSGFDHVHARCDPNRYIQQVRLFHDIVGFKRLGIVYENSVVGKSYAALSDVRKVAAERGFELVTCEAPWSNMSSQMCTRNLIQCHEMLAPRIDALFLTVHKGVDLDRMDEILKPLMAYKIPTWSQRGPQEVRRGALLSISRGGFQSIGMYHAKIMTKIFNGALPGELSQIFEDPKRIAINLETAQAIGFRIPRGLIQVADEVYKEKIKRR